MSDIITKHPAILFSEDIKAICRPLTKLNITYFSHVKVTKDGKFSGISNNPGFTEHYLKNKYYNADIHLAEKTILEKYIIWDLIERTGLSKKMHMEASQFGVQHTFTIVSRNYHSNDFYHFACNAPTQEINQVYIENIDLLKRFISYFTDTVNTSAALSNAYDLQLSIDTSAPGYTIKTGNYLSNNKTNRSKFIKEIEKINNVLAIKTHSVSSLPPQQYNCLQLLAEGYSAKKIATILNLSNRTVENYLAHVKKVLHCRNSKELIALYCSL